MGSWYVYINEKEEEEKGDDLMFDGIELDRHCHF